MISRNGEDGILFTRPAGKAHLDINFNGKDYPDHGPAVAAGTIARGGSRALTTYPSGRSSALEADPLKADRTRRDRLCGMI